MPSIKQKSLVFMLQPLVWIFKEESEQDKDVNGDDSYIWWVTGFPCAVRLSIFRVRDHERCNNIHSLACSPSTQRPLRLLFCS